MKKVIGTTILLVLFALTTIALSHVGFPKASALSTATEQTGTIHK